MRFIAKRYGGMSASRQRLPGNAASRPLLLAALSHAAEHHLSEKVSGQVRGKDADQEQSHHDESRALPLLRRLLPDDKHEPQEKRDRHQERQG